MEIEKTIYGLPCEFLRCFNIAVCRWGWGEKSTVSLCSRTSGMLKETCAYIG